MTPGNPVLGLKLQAFGGHLRCYQCGKTSPLGRATVIVHRLSSGWPECCGYTMTWVTARQLAQQQG